MSRVMARGALRAVVILGVVSAFGSLSGGGPLRAQATPSCFGRPATIVGTAEDDRLLGTAESDVIVGKAGDDTIKAKGGHDFICGWEDHDRLRGGTGDDRIQGNAGADYLYGDTRDSEKYANGDDLLLGGPRHDTATWQGNKVGIWADLVEGKARGDGHDRLVDIESLTGGRYKDRLFGDRDSNRLIGDDADFGNGRGGRDYCRTGTELNCEG